MDDEPDRRNHSGRGVISDITMSELKILLDTLGAEIVEAAQRELGLTRTVRGKKRRSIASGTLRDNLAYTIKERSGKGTIDLGARGEAENYIRFVIEGRRKGAKMPPPDKIEKWIQQKNVRLQKKGGGFIKSTPQARRSAAFLMARSIGKKGIEPFPFYENAIESTLEKNEAAINRYIEKKIELRLKLK
jgi:hypothetical protein